MNTRPEIAKSRRGGREKGEDSSSEPAGGARDCVSYVRT